MVPLLAPFVKLFFTSFLLGVVKVVTEEQPLEARSSVQ